MISEQFIVVDEDTCFGHWKVVILMLGSQPVASGHLSLRDSKRPEIELLVVQPNYRRLGFGRKMLSELIRIARLEDPDCVVLEVPPGNTAAIKLYESEGFRRVYDQVEWRTHTMVLRLRRETEQKTLDEQIAEKDALIQILKQEIAQRKQELGIEQA